MSDTAVHTTSDPNDDLQVLLPTSLPSDSSTNDDFPEPDGCFMGGVIPPVTDIVSRRPQNETLGFPKANFNVVTPVIE